MTGKVLEVKDILSEDQQAVQISEYFTSWDMARQIKKNSWEEVRRYVYATDTTQTTNSQLPWKNKTTIPKICQIRDNIYANYTATLFPKRKWLRWEGDDLDSNSMFKVSTITNYMSWAIDQPAFKTELDKIILDFIDFGNCFGMVQWVDQRVEQVDKTQTGYVGPAIIRIDPLNIVFNPTAENFYESPKIIRSYISLGELKGLLLRMSNDENREAYEKLYHYLREIRAQATDTSTDWAQKDRLYAMDGFTSYREYLKSNTVEVLTFYGDWYDVYTDTFQKNRVITVVDRHKLIDDKPNPSFFGYPPIFHVPWRKKQDNLWGMGPLDNLIGMQYRLDHIENMKSDVFDLITYPVQKIKGFVEEFTWQPGEKIFVSEEGDVELVSPDVQALNANLELDRLEAKMEEMAGAPKEAMGFRSPGEKTKYEVQRLENASSRIFQNKITQFEEQILEPLLNAMLELAKRNLPSSMSIKVINDDIKTTTFQTLSPEDITGAGRIKPIAARNFAERAEMIQNLTSLTGSNLWGVVQPHFSGVQLAKLVEDAFDLRDHGIVLPYIALAEQADAQRQVQYLQERLHQESGTATGLGDDFDLSGPGAPSPSAHPGFGLTKQPPANATPTGTIGTT